MMPSSFEQDAPGQPHDRESDAEPGPSDDGSISPKSAAGNTHHGPSRVAQTTGPKVRFSAELQRDAENGRNISPSRTTPSISPAQSAGPSTRHRNRGYSLRRTIFTQNMGKDEGKDAAAIELETPVPTSTGDVKSIGAGGPPKRQTTVTISEPVEEEDVVSSPVRLSDPKNGLPVTRSGCQSRTTNQVCSEESGQHGSMRKRIYSNPNLFHLAQTDATFRLRRLQLKL